MPLISVIIATHSRPHLLPRAVESAFKAGADVEVIVVDDASTDKTATVCKNLPNIRYIRLDCNQGVAGARNVGILASTGKYITFHDDDDIRFPGSLDRQVALLEAHSEAGLCYAPIVMGDQDANPTDKLEPARLVTGDIFWELLAWNPIICLSAVFRKDCLFRVGLVNKDVPGFDDWDLWVRISEFFSVVALDDPIGIWRSATPFSGQGSSASASHLKKTTQHQSRLFHLPRAIAAPAKMRDEARRQRLNKTSDWLICDAADWLAKGARGYARENLFAALGLNPLRASRPWTFKLLLSSLWPTKAR